MSIPLFLSALFFFNGNQYRKHASIVFPQTRNFKHPAFFSLSPLPVRYSFSESRFNLECERNNTPDVSSMSFFSPDLIFEIIPYTWVLFGLGRRAIVAREGDGYIVFSWERFIDEEADHRRAWKKSITEGQEPLRSSEKIHVFIKKKWCRKVAIQPPTGLATSRYQDRKVVVQHFW